MSLTDTGLDTRAAELLRVLKSRRWLCATAESCTGGLVAGAITAIAGSSDGFDRGFITYTNAAKVELLGVPVTTLDMHGAVSEATARAMAEGALARSAAHVAVAVTGIAGPSGGTPEKPVGTVWFAWAVRDGRVVAEGRALPGDRAAVRLASVAVALDGLIAVVDATH